MVTAIVRFVSFYNTDLLEDPTFFSVKLLTWTVIEPSVYLIAVILPSLRPLIRKIFQDVDYGSFFTRLRSYYVRIFSKERETDNIPLTATYGSSTMKVATDQGGASSGTTSIGFKRLENSIIQQHASSGSDERGVKTLHTYRERYENEEDEDKL